MQEWRVEKKFNYEGVAGAKAQMCLSIGDTDFLLVYASTGRPAPAELLYEIAYEHDVTSQSSSQSAAGPAGVPTLGRPAAAETESGEDNVA